MSDGQAVIILIDNSISSINADFYPNRLDAQSIAAERLISYYRRKSAKTQIGIGALSGKQCGILSSLSDRETKANKAISQIKREGEIKLEHAIRCAFLALRHRDKDLSIKRVIAFVASHHEMTHETADKLAAIANREGTAVDIVAIGSDVNDMDVLEEFVSKLQLESHFIVAEAGSVILADLILASPIGPGVGSNRTLLDPTQEDDPDVALAIRQSLEGQGGDDGIDANDPEILAAIQESLKGFEQTDEIDPELQAALAASLEPLEVESAEPEQPKEEPQYEELDDIDDPELQEAIRLSMMANEELQEDEDPEEKKKREDQEMSEYLQNPDNLKDALADLPGVDVSKIIDDKDKDKKESK